MSNQAGFEWAPPERELPLIDPDLPYDRDRVAQTMTRLWGPMDEEEIAMLLSLPRSYVSEIITAAVAKLRKYQQLVPACREAWEDAPGEALTEASAEAEGLFAWAEE